MFLYDDSEPTTLGGETYCEKLDRWGAKWGIPRRERADAEYRLAIIESIERWASAPAGSIGIKTSFREMIRELQSLQQTNPTERVARLLRSFGA